LGYVAANSGALKAVASRVPGGGLLLRGADNLTKLKIGSKSYADAKKAGEEKYTRTAELIEKTAPVVRRRGETDAAYEKRAKDAKDLNKTRADNYLGVKFKADGDAVAGRVGTFGITRHDTRGIQAAQAARVKTRSKGAEGKIKERIAATERAMSNHAHNGKDQAQLDTERTNIKRSGDTAVAFVNTQITNAKNRLTTTPVPGPQEQLAIEAELNRLYKDRDNAVKDRDNALKEVDSYEKLQETLDDLNIRKEQAAK
jgi:hypothetical protein